MMYDNKHQFMRIKVQAILLVAVLVKITHVTSIGQPITVKTGHGVLSGIRDSENYRLGQDISTVDIYLGVPYAKPPIGDLRFQEPQPVERWTGLRNATQKAPICPQPSGFPHQIVKSNLTISEDCLYLNIYAPVKLNSTKSYPVLVYIHDGDFISGSGSVYDGRILARFGVVVVTINFRLGILGFLSDGRGAISGNYGLMDQVMALKWVKDNIDVFRGNPKKVTIFGSGSGAVSAGLLMLSKKARGLFLQAMMGSGPFTKPGIVVDQQTATSQFEHASKLFGCSYGGIEARIGCIKNVDSEEMTKTMGLKFKPSVDGSFIEEPLERLLQTTPANPVPTLLGFVEDEAMRRIALQEILRKRSVFKDKDKGGMILSLDIPTGLKRLVYHEYGYSEDKSAVSTRNAMSKMMTDRLYVSPTVKFADFFSRHGVPVYLYQFKHHVTVKTTGLEDITWLGRYTYHGVDLPFTFGVPYLGELQSYDWHQSPYQSEERFLSKSMMSLWTNFVKRGNPSDLAGGFRPVKWAQYEANSTSLLLISERSIAMGSNPRADSVAFWNSIIPTLTEKNPQKPAMSNCKKSYVLEMTILASTSVILFVWIFILATCLLCRPRHQVKDVAMIECNERRVESKNSY